MENYYGIIQGMEDDLNIDANMRNQEALERLNAVAARTGAGKMENVFLAQIKRHKKALIALIVLILLSGGGFLGFNLMPKVAKTNYSETYRMAKKIRVEVQRLKNDASCENVEVYVSSAITKAKDYAEYLEKCKVVGQEVSGMLDILGKTAGVTQDAALKAQFVKFKKVFKKITERDNEKLARNLKLYRVWHDFVLSSDKVSGLDQADADLVAAAEPLIKSGDEKLKNYGETWAVKRMAAAKANREYHANVLNADLKDKLLADKVQKEKEYNTWVSAYKPSMKEVAPLETIDTLSLYNEYEKFYKLVKETYQKNYNQESRDCWALGDQVVCE